MGGVGVCGKYAVCLSQYSASWKPAPAWSEPASNQFISQAVLELTLGGLPISPSAMLGMGPAEAMQVP